jgi:hypothetical protein
LPGRKLPRFTSAALVCVLLALVIYRAKTQSFTIDEAFTFNQYIDRPFTEFFFNYDASNHFLHTLLTKFVRYSLGTSELVLRLISLAGALLYFVAVRRLCLMASGAGWIHVIGVAALCLNPLVLDFMVAARGYGLAVALLLWSVYYSLRWLGEGGEEKLIWRAGFAAGLSVAAHLTMLIPAAALGATLISTSVYRGRRSVWAVIDRFGGPAIIVPFLFAILPLAKAKPENFYYGSATLIEAVASIWDQSYRGGWLAPQYLREAALPAVFVLMSVVSVAVLAAHLRKNWSDFAASLFVFTALPLSLSLAALTVMNRVFQVPFPLGRSGLYLFPLFFFAMLSGSALMLRGTPALRFVGFCGAAALAFSALVFIAHLNLRYFAEWRFDASTNRLIDAIANAQKAKPYDKFSVAGSAQYENSLKYYRKRRKLHYMSPGIVGNLETAGADYFVLGGADRAKTKMLGLHVLMEDPLTGAIVARRL